MKSLFSKKKIQDGKLGEVKDTAAVLRIQKDLDDLTLDPNVTYSKPDPKSIMELIVTISVVEDSFWKGGKYDFLIKFSADYPHKAPNCSCVTKIFHPNIELPTGNVCLNILRKDWTPVFTLTGVIMGLQFLFFEPEPTDPLNMEAAEMMRNSEKEFSSFVKKTLKGGNFYSHDFKKFI